MPIISPTGTFKSVVVENGGSSWCLFMLAMAIQGAKGADLLRWVTGGGGGGGGTYGF